MTRDCRGLATLVLLVALGGCGLKGPLYIPSPEADAETQESPRSEADPAGSETDRENENAN